MLYIEKATSDDQIQFDWLLSW